jgi:hypothetical protein
MSTAEPGWPPPSGGGGFDPPASTAPTQVPVATSWPAAPAPVFPSDGTNPARAEATPGLPVAPAVAVGIAMAISVLIGLARFGGAWSNASSGSFVEWPSATWLAALELLAGLAGFAGALAILGSPAQRSPARYLFLAVAAFVFGYAVNDGLYQLITIVHY